MQIEIILALLTLNYLLNLILSCGLFSLFYKSKFLEASGMSNNIDPYAILMQTRAVAQLCKCIMQTIQQSHRAIVFVWSLTLHVWQSWMK